MSVQIERSPRAVTRLARAVRFSIRVISVVLPLLYAWLSFRDLSLGEIVKTIANSTILDVLWKLTLLVYYTAWVVGASIDTNFHEDVSVRAPFGGRLPLQAMGLLVVFLIVAALLLYSRTFEQFVLFITLFFTTNYVSYRYIVREFTRPMLDESRAAYLAADDHFGIERIAIFERYMIGRWQFWRFMVGYLIIAILIAIAALSRLLGESIPYLREIPIEVIQLVGMAGFVVILEIWIFYMRLKTIAALAALEDLSGRYDLRPRA
jgi:hypothetical protein